MATYVNCQQPIDKIVEHGFSARPYFEVLLLEYNGIAVGYALYFFPYIASLGAPILYLKDLFVENDYQGLGLGKALLSHLAQIAIEKNCCRMDWQALLWNEKAIEFYKYLGAVPRNETVQFRLTDENLKKLAEYSRDEEIF
jgi:GNAT superfamily N-acetyltransferase